jgi:hypothetical protein
MGEESGGEGVGGRKEVVQGQLYRTSANASGEDLQGGPREDADGGERGVSARDRLGIPGDPEGLGVNFEGLEHVMNGLPGDVEEV